MNPHNYSSSNQTNVARPQQFGCYNGWPPPPQMQTERQMFNNQFSTEHQNYRRPPAPFGFDNYSPNVPRNNFMNTNINNMQPINNVWSTQKLNADNNNPRSYFQNNNQRHNMNRPNNNVYNDNGFSNRNRNGNQQQQHNNGQRFQKNKNIQKKGKEKIDKRDLAENNVFYCDICDRGCKTEEIFTEHVSNHKKCRVDGCSYVAAPKLVTLHYNMQHRTGYANKIWSQESKEEVDNWIKARKSNYPTALNISKKKKLSEEKAARGELLETKQFGKMKGNRNRKQNKRKPNDDEEFRENKKMKANTCPLSKDSIENGISVDIRVPTVHDGRVSSQSNTTTDTKIHKSEVYTESSESVGLTSILSCYGDESDSQSEEEIVTGEKRSDITKDEDGNKEGNNKEADIDEDNDTEVKGNNEDNINTKKNNRRKRRNKQNRGGNSVQNRKKKPTLLEMLLANEIRHERNVILQCVHYIVKKKFFQSNDSVRNSSNNVK